jgi:hypothetical protein
MRVNIEIDLQEIEWVTVYWVGWLRLALVNSLMNLRVP